MKSFLGRYITYVRARKLWNEVKLICKGAMGSSSIQEKRVLIWPFRAFDMTLLPEIVLAEALQLRGVKSFLFFCDGTFDACEHFMYGDDNKAACKNCQLVRKKSSNSTNAATLLGQQYISEAEKESCLLIAASLSIEEIKQYKKEGVAVGHIAFSSARRYLLKEKLDYSDEKDDYTIRWYFKNALMVLKASSRLLDELKPDALLTSHGIYNSWGIITELCKLRNIQVSTWAVGYRKNTILLVQGGSYHEVLYKDSINNWRVDGWNNRKREIIKTYLQDRERAAWDGSLWILSADQARGTKKHNGKRNSDDRVDSSNKANLVYHELGLQPDVPTLGLFTNVAWDASILREGMLFSGMFEWALKTIELFIGRSDRQLIIRVHPGEVKHHHESRQKMAQEIAKRFGKLPDNIKLICPENDISSYRLTTCIDAAVIYGTKFGLELACAGIPVIVSGDAFVRNKGFTFDPEDMEEYVRLVQNPHIVPRMSEAQRDLALEYAYYFFFQIYRDFNLVGQREKLFKGSFFKRVLLPPVQLNFRSWRALLPGRNDELDSICQNIIATEKSGQGTGQESRYRLNRS